MKRPTIGDVAATAGVSTATVSRVLNGGNVTQSTATKVRAAATELGYSPNALTKGVFAGRSSTIGVVIRDLSSPFYLELIRGIDEVAAANDSMVMLANTYRKQDREVAQIRAMDEQRVRGMVTTSGPLTDEWTRRMAHGGTPCVVVTRSVPDPIANMHTISLDNAAAGALSASHLIACGRTAIGVVSGGGQPSQCERLAGMRELLGQHGLPLPDDAVLAVDDARDARDAVGRLLHQADRRGRPLDAVACITGRLTAAVYTALQGLGRVVPGDVAFLSMDDVSWAAALGLTVVTQPSHRMGTLAADLIVQRPTGPVQLVLDPALVVRRSCGEVLNAPSSVPPRTTVATLPRSPSAT